MSWFSTENLTLQNLLAAKPKLELGSTATPWMPSKSEVTTADWPKYVGFSNTVKTNKSASDYTWFPVKDSELTNKVESHVNNKANPHAVTASQVGAYSKQEIDTKLSKAVMADDSGKVTVEDLNVNGKISDLGMSNFTPRTTTWSSNGVNIAFTRVGPLVIGVWGGSQSNVAQGFTYTTPVPSGFRPNTQAKLLVVQSAVSNINIDTNGTVKYWGVPATNGNLSGTLAYFTNDPFPES